MDMSPLAAAQANRTMDIREIAERSAAFRSWLDGIKSGIASRGFTWYPYDSFGNFFHMDRLLTGERRRLLDLIGEETVLDIGCADGDVAFFFESLGCRVRAVDFPSTNFNGMQGIRELKAALNSTVEIHPVDLDSHFTLLNHRYGLVLFLGVLYHLKNPFHVLETLANHARYCVLSTRVARFAPDRTTPLHRVPVAYLLNESEANNDATNYWIFSEAGLRRLVERTKWTICDYMTIGNTSTSEPVHAEGDERAFCLLKSRVMDPGMRVQLGRGWHDLEQGTWRWTEKRFAARLAVTDRNRRATLRLKFVLPEVLMNRVPSVHLQASVDGLPLGGETYRDCGEHVYVAAVPPESLGADFVPVEFAVDNALPPDDADQRERAIVVLSVSLE
jgi:2-polyprenyl-3-methyl-5-hydroxy-6-metoxy-1,4-benzoquinol methylase